MVLAQYSRLQVGVVASALASIAAKETAPTGKGKLFREEGEHFGDMLPFADPMWMQDWWVGRGREEPRNEGEWRPRSDKIVL
jgi:hypothetical protein